MSINTEQFKVSDGIREIQLSGEKLDKETNNLEKINKIGSDLYKNNTDFIKSHVPGNWYVVVEPTSGKLIAGINQLELYQYTSTHYPNKIFYIIGLLKVNYQKHEYARA